MAMSITLFHKEFFHIVGISFTALVLNELIMVAFQIHKWTRIMVISEVLSIFLYMISLLILKTDADPNYVFTGVFWKNVTIITLVSTFPLFVFNYVKRKISPPSSSKLSN